MTQMLRPIAPRQARIRVIATRRLEMPNSVEPEIARSAP
jgi:hypothetical protein